MLRALLVFAAIITVFSQNCQQKYQYYQHDDGILSQLNGTFYYILTSSETVIDCEKMTWTGSGDNLQAIIQSPGCCRRVHSPIYTSEYVNFTVTPINSLPGCPLQTTETIAFKTVSTTRNGGNLCITCTACRKERQGVYKISRQQEVSVLDRFTTSLVNLIENVIRIALGQPPLVYNTVCQENCVFPENNCAS